MTAASPPGSLWSRIIADAQRPLGLAPLLKQQPEEPESGLGCGRPAPFVLTDNSDCPAPLYLVQGV